MSFVTHAAQVQTHETQTGCCDVSYLPEGSRFSGSFGPEQGASSEASFLAVQPSSGRLDEPQNGLQSKVKKRDVFKNDQYDAQSAVKSQIPTGRALLPPGEK